MSGTKGISMTLPGSSTIGVGCVCSAEHRMWMTLDDPFQTTACGRCNRTWHTCLMHYTTVAGEPKVRTETKCTCSKAGALTSQPSTNCLFCSSPHFLVPFETMSTKICSDCNKIYHNCPLHGTSVEGPGFKLADMLMSQCQCHQYPDFLEKKKWATPFL